MLASRYAFAVTLPLLLAACGGSPSTPVGPDPAGPATGDLQDLRDAVAEFADDWAQRDGNSPPALDRDGLAARDAEIARVADRTIRSEVLILDDDAEWSSADAVTPPASGPDRRVHYAGGHGQRRRPRCPHGALDIRARIPDDAQARMGRMARPVAVRRGSR